MAQKMATVERVGDILEKLRAASWDHAVKGTANRIVVLPLLFSSFGHSEEAVYFLVFFFCITCFKVCTNISSFYPWIQNFAYSTTTSIVSSI